MSVLLLHVVLVLGSFRASKVFCIVMILKLLSLKLFLIDDFSDVLVQQEVHEFEVVGTWLHIL